MAEEDVTKLAPDQKAKFVGEEGGDERSTPAKDFAASIFLAVFSIATIWASATWENPGESVLTSPALLPFLTGASLLLMAFFLGLKAVRHGGAENVAQALAAVIPDYLSDEENRRGLVLIALVFLYIVLVGTIEFDLRIPTPVFNLRFSSYELISIIFTTLILRMFWKAPLPRCLIVALVMVLVLAGIFRYAFNIIMPAAG